MESLTATYITRAEIWLLHHNVTLFSYERGTDFQGALPICT